MLAAPFFPTYLTCDCSHVTTNTTIPTLLFNAFFADELVCDFFYTILAKVFFPTFLAYITLANFDWSSTSRTIVSTDVLDEFFFCCIQEAKYSSAVVALIFMSLFVFQTGRRTAARTANLDNRHFFFLKMIRTSYYIFRFGLSSTHFNKIFYTLEEHY